MQCPSCRFENMPGLDACGRCGSNLRLATAVMDVNPPRASAWQKRLRRWLPWSAVNRLRDAARRGAVSTAQLLDDAGTPLPRLPVLARLTVPGWAHFFTGQNIRGRIFLGAYLALLGTGVLLWGTGLGNVLLGFAFSVHASSAIDILFQTPMRILTRITMGLATLLILGTAVYAPANWLLTRVASPVTVQEQLLPLFQDGDVLLVNRWSSPGPGSIVLYDLRSAPLEVNARFGAGQWIDRVVAGPGDHVVWNKGKLLINGWPSSLTPLNPAAMPDQVEITEVPAGMFVIFPTSMRIAGNAANAFRRAMSTMSLVPAHRIHGTVYLRSQPFTRWSVIH